MAKNPQRGRTSMVEAKAEIREKTDELIKFIESQGEACSLQKAISIHGIALDEVALRANKSTNLKTQTRNEGNQSSKGFAQPSLAINQFKAMATEYKVTSEQRNDLQRPTWMRWEQDKKDLHALNQEALRIAAGYVHEAIMLKATLDTAAVLPDSATAMEEVAWDLLKEARPNKSTETWGLAAQEMLQAVEGFLKLVS